MTATHNVFLFILLVSIHALTAYSKETSRGCKNGPGNLKCQSCISGRYGSNCQYSCQGECDIHGCNRTTGICYRCQPGYHGSQCTIRCPKYCSSNINDGIADCARYTGACLEHCTPGMTGSHCDQMCPENCKSSVCAKQGGGCFLGCKPGWRGIHCNIPCNNCLEGRCTDSGYCTTNCKPGFYGDLCDKRCTSNGQMCHLSGCDRISGRCDQCSPGYHGEHCNKKCNSNCHKGRDSHRDCDRYDGRCLEDCESGWHGSHCNTTCSENCKDKECYNPHGRCTNGCEPGWYGSHCRSTCSKNCQNGLCNQHNGHCKIGCKQGFFGEHCEKGCDGCDECDRASGRCLKCPTGYCGITCSEKCSTNCHADICNINGTCVNGCKNNIYFGHMCENKCAQDCIKCDHLTGDCVTKAERYKRKETSDVNSGAIHISPNIIVWYVTIVLSHLVCDVP